MKENQIKQIDCSTMDTRTKDNTRTIAFIEEDHDVLDEEIELAINSTDEENLLRYCAVLSAQFAMQGIDLKSHPVERIIYYIE